MHAVREIHFIADIESKTDGPQKSLNPAARIKFGDHVVVSEILERTGESAKGRRPRREVIGFGSPFGGDEQAYRALVGLELGPEQTVDPADVGPRCKTDSAAGSRRRETLGEHLREIVADLTFQLHDGDDVERDAAADAGQPRVPTRAPAVVFAKHAEFDVVTRVVVLGERGGREKERDDDEAKGPVKAFHHNLLKDARQEIGQSAQPRDRNGWLGSRTLQRATTLRTGRTRARQN